MKRNKNLSEKTICDITYYSNVNIRFYITENIIKIVENKFEEKYKSVNFECCQNLHSIP